MAVKEILVLFRRAVRLTLIMRMLRMLMVIIMTNGDNDEDDDDNNEEDENNIHAVVGGVGDG